MAKNTYSTDAELIEWVRNWKPQAGMNDVPGVPLSRLSISGGTMDDVRRLIQEGRLEIVSVEKSPLFGGENSRTFSYIRVAEGA